jgi:hypothetical protein
LGSFLRIASARKNSVTVFFGLIAYARRRFCRPWEREIQKVRKRMRGVWS